MFLTACSANDGGTSSGEAGGASSDEDVTETEDDGVYESALEVVSLNSDGENFVFVMGENEEIYVDTGSEIFSILNYLPESYSTMRNPFVSDGTVYFISTDEDNSDVILSVDINNLSEATVISEAREIIYSFTVKNGVLYYFTYDDDTYRFYENDLDGKDKKLFKTDDYVSNFFVSSLYIVYGNFIYDIDKDKLTVLCDDLPEDAVGIGVEDGLYYYYTADGASDTLTVYCIQITSLEIASVFEAEIGFSAPRLYDGKIVCATANSNAMEYVEILAYDVTGEMTSISSTDGYYYEDLYEEIGNYDAVYVDGNYYVYYPETVSCYEAESETEYLFTTSPENAWVTYDEYLEYSE